MTGKIYLSLFFLIVFCGLGILTILFTEFMIKTTSSAKHQKKASKDTIRSFKIGGYFSVVFGVLMIIVTWMGGLKGV